MYKKHFYIVKYFARKIDAHKVGAYSAEGAFYMTISIFPFIILLLSLVRFLPFERAQMFNFLSGMLPDEVDRFLSDFITKITNNTTNAITIFSALGLLWSASKGVYSVIGGLNSVSETKETRNYFKVKFLSLFYTLSFILIILLTFILLVFGNRIVAFARSKIPYIAVIYIIMSLRYLIGFCLLVFFFSFVYAFLPAKKQRFTTQMPGAIIASVGWIAFSYAFSFYIDNFSNYATVYGSLTAIVLLMLWLYSCMYILFFGGEINLYYQKKVINVNDKKGK